MVEKAIEIGKLSYSYPDQTLALKEIDLAVDEGESVALLGPNGAGKSTLLLHLNGILPSKNRVRIYGLPVNKENLFFARQKVGVVFQDPEDQLFMPTVFDDVAFGPINMKLPSDEVRKRVEDALAMVGMEGFEERSAHHLSLGQKRRVAIATVLSMRPEVLVIDEPTSNLDYRARLSLIELLLSFKQTKVVATHDVDFALKVCQRLVVLDEGRIVFDGQASSLIRDDFNLSKYGLCPSTSLNAD